MKKAPRVREGCISLWRLFSVLCLAGLGEFQLHCAGETKWWKKLTIIFCHESRELASSNFDNEQVLRLSGCSFQRLAMEK
jgi:hypothetical protein